MQQAKISLTDSQADFLNRYQALGYPNKSMLVRDAIEQFKDRLTRAQLEESAQLYAEVFADDGDLQALAEQGIEDWPQ